MYFSAPFLLLDVIALLPDLINDLSSGSVLATIIPQDKSQTKRFFKGFLVLAFCLRTVSPSPGIEVILFSIETHTTAAKGGPVLPLRRPSSAVFAFESACGWINMESGWKSSVFRAQRGTERVGSTDLERDLCNSSVASPNPTSHTISLTTTSSTIA